MYKMWNPQSKVPCSTIKGDRKPSQIVALVKNDYGEEFLEGLKKGLKYNEWNGMGGRGGSRDSKGGCTIRDIHA